MEASLWSSLLHTRRRRVCNWASGFVLAACLWAPAAMAQAPPADAVPLRWSDLHPTLATIYASTHGQVDAAHRAAFEVAGDHVASRWTQAQVGVAPATGLTPAIDGTSDSLLYGWAILALSDTPGRQRAWYEQQASTADVEARAARFAWEANVVTAWLAWFAFEQVVRHLDHDLVEYEEELIRLREARDAQVMTALEWAEFEAELARLRSERAQAQADAQGALADLVDVAGAAVVPVYPDAAEWPAGDFERNPWQNVAPGSAAWPTVQAAEARAADLEAQAPVLESNPWLLGLGTAAHRQSDGYIWGAVTVDLYIPLSSPGRAAAEQARAEAIAWRTEAERRASAWNATVSAWALHYESLRDLWQEHRDGLVETLSHRVALYEAALAQGDVDVAALVRARRDLHEALHAQFVMESQLLAEIGRAAALLALLQEVA